MVLTPWGGVDCVCALGSLLGRLSIVLHLAGRLELEDCLAAPGGVRELGINEQGASGIERWLMELRLLLLEIPPIRYQLFTNLKCDGLHPGRSLI